MFTTNNPQPNVDLPITALCIVSDKARCPPNHTAVVANYDSPNTEPDLWKDSLFGKRVNRYFCYTKDYPINETYNVIEDIKLLNERDALNGFIPLERCLDTSEKSFQKKTLFIKVSHRYYTTTAVSDIILQVKTKRPPPGYSYIGDINNHAVCIKFSQIPSATAAGSNRSGSMVRPQGQATPPPIPPRPHSNSNPLSGGGDPALNDYVTVPRLPPVPPHWATNGPTGSGFPIVDVTSSYRDLDFNPQRHSLSSSTHTHHAGFNALNGVPFHINPSYTSNNDDSSLKNELYDAEQIQRKIQSFKKTLEKTNYDFNLERQLVASSP